MKEKKIKFDGKIIYVCSPYSNSPWLNKIRARRYCKYIRALKMMPICPHIYFTQFMDNDDKNDRNLVNTFNRALIEFCDEVWVFGSNISSGMRDEIQYAQCVGKPIQMMKRDIYNNGYYFKYELSGTYEVIEDAKENK